MCDTASCGKRHYYTLPTVNGGPDQALCDGASTVLIGSGSSPALVYTWDNGVTDGVSFVPTPGFTTFTVVGTDTTGCMSYDYVDVMVNALPAVDAGLDQTICAGDNVILHGNGAMSYTWDNGVMDSIPFSPAATATYHVSGIDASGCVNMDSIVVTVNPFQLSVQEPTSLFVTATRNLNRKWYRFLFLGQWRKRRNYFLPYDNSLICCDRNRFKRLFSQ